MLNEKHYKDLQDKFNKFSDEELLNLLMFERQNYSVQAIELADSIVEKRKLEYEIPEFNDDSEKKHQWYINAGFVILCAAAIGVEFYLSSIFDREYARVFGSLIRNGLILFLAYKAIPYSNFAFLFLILAIVALFAGNFGFIIISILILGFMYLLKYTVFKEIKLN